jgi:hypothetical protein
MADLDRVDNSLPVRRASNDSRMAQMRPDPQQLLPDLGLDPAMVTAVHTVSERHGHRIWRLVTPECSYIMKWLPETMAKVEIEAYLLLRKLGVPALPLYGHTTQALLLEDLARSRQWRLAHEADSSRPEVGQAVARWYRFFHDAGEAFLAESERPSFLTRETDELAPESILATSRALCLAEYATWELAAGSIELLKAAVARLSFTLNYNDFHWTNLALSRPEEHQLEAITFDYHLLGVGMRYSDCRNVAGSLSGEAVPAFWDGYGPVDPREAVLDAPLADLYALLAGARLARFPAWAEESRQRLVCGPLQADLEAAVELAQSLVGSGP